MIQGALLLLGVYIYNNAGMQRQTAPAQLCFRSINHPLIQMALMTMMITAVLLLLQQQAMANSGGGSDPGSNEDLRYRRHHRGFGHRNSPQTPTAPVQPIYPLPPPPPPHCNETASGGVCQLPVPAPPPRGVQRCPPCSCRCPKQQPQPPRPFPGWPVPRPVPVPGRDGSNGYCVMALAPMMTCGRFITAANDNETETATPVPTGECCSGLAAFLRTSGAAAAAGRGDSTLQCLCPFILGDVNKTLQKPIDPVKMMYLPVACGVVLPPELLFLCFSGRPLSEVNNFPQGSGRSP